MHACVYEREGEREEETENETKNTFQKYLVCDIFARHSSEIDCYLSACLSVHSPYIYIHIYACVRMCMCMCVRAHARVHVCA